MRTLIISDAHGYPQLIENALKHARFRPGLDRLIYAGDLVDRGPDPEGCLALVDRYATQVLVGNHDLAVLAGFEIFDQAPESLWLQHEFLDRVLMPDPSRWRAVAVVDDVLVSHGGISARYETLLRQCSGDLARLAAHLNRSFLAAVLREVTTGDWEDDGILGGNGPLWFRPKAGGPGLLPGVRQVVGHSPRVPSLDDLGFYMIDPGVYSGLGDPRRYRYAVIDQGQVRVEEGVLGQPAPAMAR